MEEHNKVLLTGSCDQQIGIWDVYNNFTLLHKLVQSNNESVTSLLSIDNRYFVSACVSGSLKIWDSVRFELVCNKVNSHKEKINKVQLLSKFRLVTSSNDKNATIWQL